MKWITHILWCVAVLTLLKADLVTATATAAFHTAATDALGHSGLRRNKYHDLISLLTAVVISAYMHNPAYIALGAVHIILDILSPGRLAVSVPYNILWSIPPALIILYTI